MASATYDNQEIMEDQDELLLQDSIENIDTEDESDDEELNKFFLLMDKAEKKNSKRKQRNENQFEVNKDSWRDLQLGKDDDDDSSETEDEDDYSETTKFMSLMNKAKDKNSMVRVKLVNGKMETTKINNGHEGNLMYKAMHSKVTDKLLESRPSCISSPAPTLSLEREGQPMVTIVRSDQYFSKRSVNSSSIQCQGSKSGKRKFGDRMTLAEASAEDFDNSQDYVDFLQDKLQGIKIKLIK